MWEIEKLDTGNCDGCEGEPSGYGGLVGIVVQLLSGIAEIEWEINWAD